MPESAPRYRLVIFDAIDVPQELRRIDLRGDGNAPDRRGAVAGPRPGVWPQLLDEATVRRMLDGLYEHKVAAEAWRTDQFPDLSPSRTIHRAACLGDGLESRGCGRTDPLGSVGPRGDDLRGRIMVEDEFRDVRRPLWPSSVVAGIRALALQKPRPISRLARAHRIPKDPPGEVLIVRRDPRIAFRVVESQMSYAYLGDRLKNSAAENFPIFLADLVARAGDACLPPRHKPCFRGATRPSTISHIPGASRLRHPPPALELVPPRRRGLGPASRPGHEEGRVEASSDIRPNEATCKGTTHSTSERKVARPGLKVGQRRDLDVWGIGFVERAGWSCITHELLDRNPASAARFIQAGGWRRS